MFPYELYKVIHFIGIFLTLLVYGALALQMLNGGTSEFPRRKHLMIGHGVGLFLVLLGGMGMVARLQIGFPTWIWIKIAIWIALGGLIALMRRRPQWNSWLWLAVWALAVVAGATAVYKPAF